MTTDYDPIATQYQRAKLQPWRTYLECFTLLELIGSLTDKTALDLACGTGYYTRLLRYGGASRAVGIDLSPRMIDLAREQERSEQLGIEFLVGDAKHLLLSDTFDVVVAAYLLNYAQDREELALMCQGIYDRTAPGGRFVAVNANPDCDFCTAPSYRDYGFDTCAPGDRCEGMPVTWTFYLDDGPIEIENYWLDRQIHEEALLNAGFRNVSWHVPRLAPDAQPRDASYWHTLLKTPPLTFLECQK